VRQIVLGVPSIEDVVEVKSRGSEDDVHLELLVRVAPLTPVEHSAAIADEIGRRLRVQFKGLATMDVNFLPAHELPLIMHKLLRLRLSPWVFVCMKCDHGRGEWPHV